MSDPREESSESELRVRVSHDDIQGGVSPKRAVIIRPILIENSTALSENRALDYRRRPNKRTDSTLEAVKV